MYTYPTFGRSGYSAICSNKGLVSNTSTSSGSSERANSAM